MSKNKANVIKNKRKFNFASVMKFVRTLWKNDAVVEVATTTKWYWSLIVFVLALIISVLPSTVSQATAAGSNFIGGSNVSYSDPFYNGLYAYYQETDSAYDITIDAETKTLVSNTAEPQYFDGYTLADGSRALKPFYTYTRKITDSTGLETKRDYLNIYVYYQPVSTVDLNVVLNNIQGTNTNFANGYITDNSVKNTCSTPFILFTNDTFFAANFSANGTSTFTGNFNHMNEAFELGNTFTFKDILGSNVSSTASLSETQKALFNNFLTWCDKSYIDSRTTSTWITFGIYCGINGGIMLLMGLIIWLMTRGKNNPNNKVKIWEAYSMGFWSAGSPAILSLLGFLFPQFGMMLFIMLYAFRVMFLSMKQLRPVYQ